MLLLAGGCGRRSGMPLPLRILLCKWEMRPDLRMLACLQHRSVIGRAVGRGDKQMFWPVTALRRSKIFGVGSAAVRFSTRSEREEERSRPSAALTVRKRSKRQRASAASAAIASSCRWVASSCPVPRLMLRRAQDYSLEWQLNVMLVWTYRGTHR
jgi:hypothetical protein